MKLAIVGSRNFHNYLLVENCIDNYIKTTNISPSLIISGGASGVDALAEQYAKNKNIEIQVFPADWKTHGKKAGPMRNSLIVEAATHIITFPSKDSVGTYDTIIKQKNQIKNYL